MNGREGLSERAMPGDQMVVAARPADIEVPRARPPWLTRMFVRVLDVAIWPTLMLLRGLVAVLPRGAGLAMARGVAAVVARMTTLPSFRRNLRVIAGRGQEPGEAELDVGVSTALGHQLQTIVDIVKVLDQRAVPLERVVEAQGEEHLRAALAQGRGAILLSSHLGNWELAAAWIGSRGIPFNVMYYEQLSQVLDRYLKRIRESYGCKMHHQRRGLKSAIQALRRNEVAAFVADQDGTRNGIFAEFFGVLVSVPVGPVRLALKYRCPIVHTWNHRLPDGSYRQVFAPPYVPAGEGDEAESALVRRMLLDFETVIRSDPAQWLLSYDRFKLRHLPRLEELGLSERAYADQRWLQQRG